MDPCVHVQPLRTFGMPNTRPLAGPVVSVATGVRVAFVAVGVGDMSLLVGHTEF